MKREVLKKTRIAVGFDKDIIEKLSDKAYRIRLGEKSVTRLMDEKGEKYIKQCAQSYAPITRAFLQVMQDEDVELPKEWLTRTE